MINLTELENWGNDLKPILFDINLALRNLRILDHQNSSKFKEEQNELFVILWYQQYFIIVIQLSKLFTDSDNQKRNFYKLCRKLQEGIADEEILSYLESNKLNPCLHKSCEDILGIVLSVFDKLQTEKDLIKDLSTIRNKVFAHTDPDAPEDLLTIEQLTTLTELAIEIYDLIFGKLWGQSFNPRFTSRFDFLKMIDFFNSSL